MSIIKPKPIKNFKRNRTVFIPFEPIKGTIQNLFKNKIIKSSFLYNSKIFLLKDKIILFKSLGASESVMCLERLIASGTKEILILGFCGSLKKEIPIGSVVLALKAYSQEGTSKHYFSSKKIFPASRKLFIEIKTTLEKNNLSYLTGKVVSTDAPFRETPKWIAKMLNMKIDCVDMETSAIYALANFYKIDAISLMIVSDILTKNNWISEISHIKKEIIKYFSLFI
ncbi:nucleoside phosphorylase [Candidatus Aminicenantes bacterium AH-873-B07]|nr:nucleoside phosphorylase [Candidatus Aminicenantes bacterium AH-873-B07]